MKIQCTKCHQKIGEKEPLDDNSTIEGVCNDCLALYFPGILEKCLALGVSEKDRYE